MKVLFSYIESEPHAYKINSKYIKESVEFAFFFCLEETEERVKER